MVLRVKLEIVPFGDEDKAREIGRLDIFNRGWAHDTPNARDEAGYFEYGVLSLTKGDTGMFDASLVHYCNDGAWALVQKVLSTFNIRGPR